MNRLPRVTALLASSPWAIKQVEHERLVAGLELYLNGQRAASEILDPIRAAREARAAALAETNNRAPGVAVISLHGAIYPRGSFMADMCGAADPHTFAASVDAAANDPNVGAIVLDVDSPGGAVSGIDAAAESVWRARQLKTVVAVCNTTMCSAAAWIGLQATEVVVTPGGELGSIGVIGTHVDETAYDERVGIKVTYVRSTERKALGQSSEAMDGVVLEQWTKEIGAIHGIFVGALARGRGVDEATAAAWGTGDVWFGQAAVDAGLADRVGTLGDVVAEQLAEAASRGARNPRKTEAPPRGAEGAHVKFTLKDRTGAARELDTETPQDIQGFVDAERTAEASAAAQAERERIAAGLNLKPDELTADRLADLGAEANDGRAYRASLLDRLEALNLSVRGNGDAGQAAATRARRIFATAPIADLRAEVETLEAQRDALVPQGRLSRDAPTDASGGKTPGRSDFDHV